MAVVGGEGVPKGAPLSSESWPRVSTRLIGLAATSEREDDLRYLRWSHAWRE